jgi:hypothetical protein
MGFCVSIIRMGRRDFSPSSGEHFDPVIGAPS